MVGRARAFVGAAALVAAAVFVLPTGAARPNTHRFRVSLPASAAILDTPGPGPRARAYGWPLRPFLRQHPIRGAFGDPRFGRRQRNFHFGIDIPAAGGTPVYAVAPGTVFLAPDRVAVLAPGARRRAGFAYWHVIPAVREYRAVGKGALIGWVKPAWGHLHFAEMENGAWVNPLRPGALEPYRSRARARIVGVAAAPATAGPATVGQGTRVDVTVDAYVPPPLPFAGPWRDSRLAPTFVRWRLLDGRRAVTAWRTSLDFRQSIPPNTVYDEVYAPGTVPNRSGRPGRYIVYLARDWNLGALPAADYRVEVQAQGARSTVPAATTTVDLQSLWPAEPVASSIARR